LHDLSQDALVDVLTKPKNALVKQYRELFSFAGVELQFTDRALQEVARRAQTRKTGARGLRSELERTLLDLMFEVPGSDITRAVIDEVGLDDPASILLSAERRKSA